MIKKIHQNYKFDTLSLHAGYQPHKMLVQDKCQLQTTSYLFDDVDCAVLFNLERGGHIYSRISNPTVGIRGKSCVLEGGTAL